MAWTKLASRRHLLHRDLLACWDCSHVHGAAIHTPLLKITINSVVLLRELIENGVDSFSLLPGDMNEIIIDMNALRFFKIKQDAFFFLVSWLFFMKSRVKGTILVVPECSNSDSVTRSLTDATFDFSVSRALWS